MDRARVLRVARRPLPAARRALQLAAEGRGLPVGRTAQGRRMVRRALGDAERVLVVGPPGAVRQALPKAQLDVVGTDPGDRAVTVVSEALGAGSLPQRWQCVVVVEPSPPEGRLLAAASACLPGGVVAVLSDRGGPAAVPGAHPGTVRRSRSSRLLVARLPA